MALGVLAAAIVSTARAEVRVSGSADAVELVVQDASLDEVLEELGEQFKFRYRTAADLDRRISGTYQGPLRRVIARLLDRHNYVISVKRPTDPLELVVLGAGGKTPKPAPGLPAIAMNAATVVTNSDGGRVHQMAPFPPRPGAPGAGGRR